MMEENKMELNEQKYNKEKSVDELLKIGGIFKFVTVADIDSERKGKLDEEDENYYYFNLFRYHRDGNITLDKDSTRIKKDKMVMMSHFVKEDEVPR